jgi:hypothetical protein
MNIVHIIKQLRFLEKMVKDKVEFKRRYEIKASTRYRLMRKDKFNNPFWDHKETTRRSVDRAESKAELLGVDLHSDFTEGFHTDTLVEDSDDHQRR